MRLAPDATYGGKPKEFYRKLQLKFKVSDNALLRFEETRDTHVKLQEDHMRASRDRLTEYLAAMDFENIKAIWIWSRAPTEVQWKRN